MSLSSLTVSTLSNTARMQGPAHYIQAAVTQSGKSQRRLHLSQVRHAIMMPAMSPLLTEGTITKWKKKEGEAFSVGDVLLEIESDIAAIDVEAHSAGILTKILMPDGTKNVPVEQTIALVAKDVDELANLQSQTSHPTQTQPPITNHTGTTSRLPIPGPTPLRHFPCPPTQLTSLAGLQSSKTSLLCSSALRETSSPSFQRSGTLRGMVTNPVRPDRTVGSKGLHTKVCNSDGAEIRNGELRIDGVALRRIIVSNLLQSPS